MTFSSVHSLSSDIEVISSTDHEFRCRVSCDLSSLDAYLGTDSLFTLYKNVSVGLPAGASASLTLAEGQGAVAVDAVYLDGSKYRQMALPLAVLSRPLKIRDRQFVNITIHPMVSGNIYQEVEIAVSFEGGSTSGTSSAADPVFESVYGTLMANYEQFKKWPSAVRPVAKPSTAAGPFPGATDWYKLAVNQTGIYKVTGAQLANAGLSLSGLASDDIHIYNGGGLPLEVYNERPRPEFIEMAVMINDGGDGLFGSTDYILFYGESQDRWVYAAGEEPQFVNNAYADHNVYWLSIDGGHAGWRMNSIASTAGTVDTVITTSRKWLHTEQDAMLYSYDGGEIADYYTWYWSDGTAMDFYLSTPGILSGDTAAVSLVGRTGAFSYMDLWVNGVPGLNKSCNSLGCSFRTVSLGSSLNLIELALTPNVSSSPYFDYINVAYKAENEPQNDRAEVNVGSLSGRLIRVEVANGFTVAPLVFDISDPLQPAVIDGASVSGGVLSFYRSVTDTVFNRYYITPESKALAVSSITAADPVDLYDSAEQVDLIVVAPRAFMAALQEYVDYRAAGGYAVKTAAVEDIVDNFALGLYDPTAIRDYLKYAYENYPTPAPSSVLLVGDASYDFLNVTQADAPNYVPAFIHPYDQSASDDNYVYFGRYGILDSDTTYDTSSVSFDRGYDMLISRWPVKTTAQIGLMVNRLKRYESAGDFGIWRNNITLVADDEYGAVNTETIHTIQTEELEKEHIPAIFTRHKIYLWEYPFVNRYKPEVNDAIVRDINEGTLVINYVGHGNPDLWAHEHVLTKDDDLPRLTNDDKLPLVFAASCAIGFFDHPTREGMAEEFVRLASGGAIGVISATRLVYSAPNREINQKVFDILLYHPSITMCEALYTAKLQRQYPDPDGIPITQSNDRNYLFFGDPMVRLATPQLDVEFTDAPDTLTALGRAEIHGRVVDETGSTYAADGKLYVNVYDSQREKTYRLLSSTGAVLQTIDYSVTGPTIYRGSATISNGEFAFEFYPPLDIGYGGSGARISVYAAFDDIDGAGIVDSMAVSDSIAAFTDSTGPGISVAFAGMNEFASGDLIRENEQMQVSLSDPSGVNLAGSLGHGITLEVDNKSDEMVNLTGLFEYNQDDFTSGSLEYALEELEPGRHQFKLKAWDNANNSSVLEFEAEVLSSEALAIRELLNYPNPMNESTRFSFYLTQPADRLLLEIFTLSGRKIQTITRYALNPGFYDDIEWYGKDADGDRVASEVYIYKATAFPVSGEAPAESFGKLVVIN